MKLQILKLFKNPCYNKKKFLWKINKVVRFIKVFHCKKFVKFKNTDCLFVHFQVKMKQRHL